MTTAAQVRSEISMIDTSTARHRVPEIHTLLEEHAALIERFEVELANERSKIIHCIKCGDSWYDSGFTTSCPICELVEKCKEKQHALEEVFRLS